METRGLPSGKTTEFLCQYISGLIRGCNRKRTGVRRKGGDRDGEQQAETEQWAKRCLAQHRDSLKHVKLLRQKPQSSICCVHPGL